MKGNFILQYEVIIIKKNLIKKIRIKLRRIPKGWTKRINHKYEWELISDLSHSQPLGVYIKYFNYGIGNSQKYQAKLGRFAGESCLIDPLRNSKQEAVKDCFNFMKKHKDKVKIYRILQTNSFIQNNQISI